MSELVYRKFKYDIRELNSDTGTVVGYASTFNEPVEFYDEVMIPGAFTKTLQDSGGIVPMFADHRTHIGSGTHALQDKIGLLVEGELLINDVQEARAKFALMKQSQRLGGKHGISIGMRFIKEEIKVFKPTGEKLRHLYEVALKEWSPTPFQAYPSALVTGVRDLRQLINTSRLTPEEKALVERLLREHGAADIIDEPIVNHSDEDIALLRETCDKVQQAARKFNEPSPRHSYDGVYSALKKLNETIEVTS